MDWLSTWVVTIWAGRMKKVFQMASDNRGEIVARKGIMKEYSNSVREWWKNEVELDWNKTNIMGSK